MTTASEEATPTHKATVRIDGTPYLLDVTTNSDGTLTIHKTSEYREFATALGYTPSISIGEQVLSAITSHDARSTASAQEEEKR